MILGTAAKSALRAAGYYRRRLRNDRFPGPLVLCYHNVLPNNASRNAVPFERLQVSAARLNEHCRVLAETCQPIDVQTFFAGETAWPARPVLLTFDDGYRNLLTVAAPILAQHGIPAVFFACTGPEELGGALWVDRVGAVFGEQEVERFKTAPDDERRQVLSKTPAYPFTQEHCRLMTADDLKRLARTAGWAVGGHSHTHPILARCRPEEQRREIRDNLAALESIIGTRPTAFAYPNGRPEHDYDETTRQALAEEGVQVAFTTGAGFASRGGRPYDLPRMMMLESISGTELLHRMSLSWR